MNNNEEVEKIMQTSKSIKRDKHEAMELLSNFKGIRPEDIRLVLETIWNCYDLSNPNEEYLINELMQFAKAICPKEYDNTKL